MISLKDIYDQHFLRNDERYVIFMDNLRAHKTKKVI
jgi:hypothetical protein